MRRLARIVKSPARHWVCGAFLAASLVALTSVVNPAQACMSRLSINLAYVNQADVVVVGRISNYTIVLDPLARQRQANAPDTSSEAPESAESEQRYLSDYARFDVLVDEVLVGEVPETLTVMWSNSTFGELGSMPSGPFLIALRDFRSAIAAFKASGATLPNPEPPSFEVLQAPCSDPFILASSGESARAVLEILPR